GSPPRRDARRPCRASVPQSLAPSAGASPCFSWRRFRRLGEKLGQVLLPPLRLRGGAVPGRVGTGGNDEDPAVLHALDLALHHAELGRIPLIVGRVDRE